MTGNRKSLLFIVILGAALLGPGPKVKAERRPDLVVLYGEQAASGEIHAAHELAKDLAKVYDLTAEVISEQEGNGAEAGAARFLVGTADSHSLIVDLVKRGDLKVSAEDPGPEAYVIRSWPDKNLIVIAGCDERGTLYGVYKFSERWLGIDPFEFGGSVIRKIGVLAQRSGFALPMANDKLFPALNRLFNAYCKRTRKGHVTRDFFSAETTVGCYLCATFWLCLFLVDSVSLLFYGAPGLTRTGGLLIRRESHEFRVIPQ